MSIYIVVGLFGCRKYATAEYFARHLAEQFSDIKIKCQAFSESEYKDILAKMRPVLHSNHSESPLIWKDCHEIGTCPIYIGDEKQFLNYCKENFGTACILSPDQVLVSDKFECISPLMRWFVVGMHFITDEVVEMHFTPEEVKCIPFEKKNEQIYSWFMPNYHLMAETAANIDKFCTTSPRVIVTCIKPLCFNAHALIHHSKVLKTEQVIASTNYLGLEPLPYLSKATNIPINEISAPPVWGYIGLNQLVDTCHTKCNYRLWEITTTLDEKTYGAGEDKGKNGSDEVRSPPPPVINEERDLCFRSHSFEYIWRWVGEYKRSAKDIYGCDPYMSQVNSAIEIIKLWFDGDKRPKTEVISAGILSTGSYGIPKGIVFSQPVHLEDGLWKPYQDIEEPHFQINLRYLTTLPLIISSKFELCPELDHLIEPTFYPEKEKPKARKMTLAEQKEMLMKALGQKDKKLTNNKELSESELEERDLKKIQIKEDLKKLREELKDRELQQPTSWYRIALEKVMDKLVKEGNDCRPSGIRRESTEDADTKKEEGVEINDNKRISNNVDEFMEQLDKGINKIKLVQTSNEPDSKSISSSIQNEGVTRDYFIPALDENVNEEDLKKLPDTDFYKEIFTDYYYRKMLALHDEDDSVKY